MQLVGFDHLVLTVSDIQASLAFYTQVLCMKARVVGGRHELHFAKQKINLHARPGEFLPAAKTPTNGSADFCLVAQGPMRDIVAHVSQLTNIELGPVPRSGAQGGMSSIYVRDPDQNLVEICVY